MNNLSQYSSHIELFNAALLRCGEDIIQSQDAGATGELFRGAYAGIVRSVLHRHKWSFATKRERLQKQGETGNSPKYAYNLPADLLIIHKVAIHDVQIINYDWRSDVIAIDIDSDCIDIEYGTDARVGVWSADFAEAVVVRLEALIKAFHEDREAERAKKIESERLILDAIARDVNSQGRPQATSRNRLGEVYRGGVFGRRRDRYSRR